jgi:hypothetical protein
VVSTLASCSRYLGIGIPPQPGLLALVFQGQDLQILLRRRQGLLILAQPGVGVIQPAIDAHGPEQRDPGQQNEDPLAQAEGCDLLRPSLPLCLHVHQGVSRAMPLSWKASWPSCPDLRAELAKLLTRQGGGLLEAVSPGGHVLTAFGHAREVDAPVAYLDPLQERRGSRRRARSAITPA